MTESVIIRKIYKCNIRQIIIDQGIYRDDDYLFPPLEGVICNPDEYIEIVVKRIKRQNDGTPTQNTNPEAAA